jgi:fucose permease
MLSIGFATNTPALCLTAIADELALNSAHSGLFLSCAFWGLVVSIPISGPLADRWGFRYLLVGSAALQALGLLLVSHAHQAWHACLGAGITGLGTGIVDALLTPLACAAYPKARAKIANLLHAFYPIGMFLVVLIVIVLMWRQWSWREIYRCIAVTNLPYAVIFLIIPLPRQSHEGPQRLPGRRLIRRGSFLLFFGAIFLAGVTELGPSQWLPAYLEQAAGGTRTASALGLLLLGVMMALGRLGNSFLARHVSPRRLVVAGAALSVVSLLLASLPAGRLFTIFCLGMLGLGVSGLWPTILSLAGDRFPQAGASMYSLLHTSGNLGGLVGPLVIGLVAQSYGLRLGMATLTLAPLMVLLLRALDRKTVRGAYGDSLRP